MKTAALIAAALLAASTVASAEMARADDDEPVPAKAKKLAQRGRELHDRGDYDRAIVAFKEAYIIAPSPALLFNLAQAYRLQGNCDDSSLMYRRFLRTGPDYNNQKIAEDHLATVERCMAKRNLGIKLDDSMAYLQQPAVPSPGDIVLRDNDPEPGLKKKRIGIGLGIGGGVALLSALYFGVQASADASSVERAVAMGVKWKEVEELDARGQRRATYAKVFGVAGGLAAAAGVTMYVMGMREERASQITVVPTTNGIQASLGWRF